MDDVCQRKAIDLKCNARGNCLLEFLLSTNCCVLNGCSQGDDFNCISNQGTSVVNYLIVPHEYLQSVISFKVNRVREVLLNADGNDKVDPSHNGILTWRWVLLNMLTISTVIKPPPRWVRFDLASVIGSFMDNEECLNLLTDIDEQLHHITSVTDVDDNYKITRSLC